MELPTGRRLVLRLCMTTVRASSRFPKPRAASRGPPSREPSHLLRQHERLAIGPSEQAIRLGVVEDGLGLGVEAERVAGAEGDVAEVAEARTLVSFLDVGVGSSAVANAVEEVLQVSAVHGHLLRGVIARADRIAGGVADLPSLPVEGQDAVLTVQRHAPRLPLEAWPGPDAVLP